MSQRFVPGVQLSVESIADEQFLPKPSKKRSAKSFLAKVTRLPQQAEDLPQGAGQKLLYSEGIVSIRVPPPNRGYLS